METNNLIVEFMPSQYEAPVQLIYFDDKKQMQVGKEASEFISDMVTQCREFGVVSVVGNYRTGKSYFINQILLNRPKSFTVSSTVNACTRGLWLWPQLIKITDKKTESVKYSLVIDTEGIGNVEEGQKHDTKIFLMALLISSKLIYNSLGAINESAIENLNLIVKLSKHLNIQSETQFQQVIDQFPSFVWILRDFSLQLQDQFGYKISPKQYLDQSLAQQKGLSEATQNKNRIRRQITAFFKERDCLPLVRPTKNEKDLQNLENIGLSNLRQEFQDQVQEVRNKIYGQIKAKFFNGVSVTPTIFLDMCQEFCDSINSGNIPTVQSSWNFICQSAFRHLSTDIQDQVRKEIDQINREDVDDVESLNQKLQGIQDEYIQKYQQQSQKFNDIQMQNQGQNQLVQEIQSLMQLKQQEVEAHLNEQVSQQLEVKLQKLNKNFQEKEYDSVQNVIQELEKERLDGEERFKNSDGFRCETYKNLYMNLKGMVEKFEQQIVSSYGKQLETKEFQLQSYMQEIQKLKQEYTKEKSQLKDSVQELTDVKNKQNIQIQNYKQDIYQVQVQLSQMQERYKVKEEYYLEQRVNMQEKFDQIQLQLENDVKDLKQSLCDMQVEKNQILMDKEQREKEIRKEVLETQKESEEINDEVIRLNQEVLHLTNLLQGNVQFHQYRSGDQVRKTLSLNLKLNADHFLKDWKIEKDHLVKSIKETKGQISEYRSLQKEILQQLNNSQSSVVKDQSLMRKHQILEKTIKQSEGKCEELEDLVEKLKNFYKMVRYTSQMKCKLCSNQYNVSDFMGHLQKCKDIQMQQSVKISVQPQYQFDNQHQFQVTINYQGQNWNIVKKLPDFIQLAELIQPYIQNVPGIVQYFINMGSQEPIIFNNNPSQLEDIAHKIQQLMQFFWDQTEIRDLREFGDFLGNDLQKYLLVSPNRTMDVTQSEHDSPCRNEDLLRESLMQKVSEFCSNTNSEQKRYSNRNNNNQQQQQYNNISIPLLQPSFQNIAQIIQQDSQGYPLKNISNSIDLQQQQQNSPIFGKKSSQQQQEQQEIQFNQDDFKENQDLEKIQKYQQEDQVIEDDPVIASQNMRNDRQFLRKSLKNINQFTSTLKESIRRSQQQQQLFDNYF